MTQRIFLRTSDLMELSGCKTSAAWREMQFIRAVLNKKKIKAPKNAKTQFREIWQKVTIKEYCELNDLDESQIKQQLKIK